MSATQSLRIGLTLGGTTVPAFGFEASSGTYGSIGHASAATSVKMLRGLGIDLVTLGGSSSVVPMTITVYTDTGYGAVFGGEFMSSEWDFDDDRVVIHGRDWGGILVDQKRVLTRSLPALQSVLSPLAPGQSLQASGVSTMNRNVSQIVTDIAHEFGFTPNVSMAPGTDVNAGSIYGSTDHVFMTIPQNLWSVLNTLARDTGNEVYVTPDKRLVFGQPGVGQTPLKLSWNTPQLMSPGPTSPEAVIPCTDLHVTHNPRRNRTFRILVISYDPGQATTVLGRATYVGDAPNEPGLSVGLHTGADAVAADKFLAKSAANKQTGSVSTLSHIQLYTFHWDGLTQSAATDRAAAIATDITKRLLLMSCRIDGYPAMLPTLPITLYSADIPPSISSNKWYVTGYRHRLTIPQGRGRGRGGEGGFWTEIQALDIPSTALATGGSTI